MVGSMKIIRNISYKTVSKAELGLTDGHITHIGYAQNFINNWKKRISIKTKLNIFFGKEKKTEIITSFINDPITNPDGSLRSPKFRSGSDEVEASLRDTIVYYYKINMMNSFGTPLLILFDITGGEYEIEAFLISTEHDLFKEIFKNLSHTLTSRNNSGEIYSKLLNSSNSLEKDFRFLIRLYEEITSAKIIVNNVENDKTIENNTPNTNNQSTSKIRQGQQNFRIKVLSAYSNRCCVTNSDLIESIEANHIEPYKNVESNNINNGIPLRADIHKLWTQGLLGIDSEYKVILNDKAKNSLTYKDFNGSRIKLPVNSNYHPNKQSLQNWCNINSLSLEK